MWLILHVFSSSHAVAPFLQICICNQMSRSGHRGWDFTSVKKRTEFVLRLGFTTGERQSRCGVIILYFHVFQPRFRVAINKHYTCRLSIIRSTSLPQRRVYVFEKKAEPIDGAFGSKRRHDPE